jgi:hypothetical protein
MNGLREYLARGNDGPGGDGETSSIPLFRRDGSIAAFAVVDRQDAAQRAYRWHLQDGYARRDVKVSVQNWRHISLHRALLGLQWGDKRQGDHVNRDRLDCRRGNLRVVSFSGNRQNRTSNKGSTSRYRGVSWAAAHGKWRAAASVDGRDYHLGLFHSEEEAAEVARAFRAEHMPLAADGFDAREEQ